MKQAETMVRFLSRALILAAMIAVLGTCEGGFVEDTPKADEIRHKPGEMVTVRVSTGGGNSPGRSIASNVVQITADYYEVVFKASKPPAGRDTYYRGQGTATQGYVTVSVPINDPTDNIDYYDVLFLAGTSRTLLAAGYRGKNEPGTWDEAKGIGPVKIKAGIANTVTITIKPFPLQWDTEAPNAIKPDTSDPTKSTNDFEFFADLADTTWAGKAVRIQSEHRQIYLANDGTTTGPIDPDADTFGVNFHIAKLDPLILADINTNSSTSSLTIAGDYTVRLKPRYRTDFFDIVPLNIVLSTTGTTVVVEDLDGNAATNDAYKITLSTAKDPVSFVNNPLSPDYNKLPNNQKDGKLAVDGVVQFELKYYAFGTPESKGTAWYIRNGINRGLDAASKKEGSTDIGTGDGGQFLVKFGAGSSAGDQEVYMDGM